MIVVTGVTGVIGHEVARALIARGIKPRAFVRNRAKAQAKFKGEEVEFVEGHFDDQASLEAAFTGAERVFLLCPVDRQQVSWNEAVIAAARKCGVRQIVRLSGILAAPDAGSEMLRLHGICDQQLVESGLGYTVLRPNSFYQNMFWLQSVIRGTGSFALPMKDARQSLLDVRDIAEVAACVLTAPLAEHDKQIYVLTGAESLTYYQVAEQLSAATGKTIRYVDVTPEKAFEMMKGYGVPEWNAETVVDFRKIIATGACSHITDVVPRLLGRAPRTFAAFAEENAALFGGQEKKKETKMQTTDTQSTTSAKTWRGYYEEIRELLDKEPHRTAGVVGSWQFNLSGNGGGSFFVEINDGKFRVEEGAVNDPGVTIAMTVDDYVAMASKKVPGAELFMGGRMRVSGDAMLGMRAEALFS